MLLIIFLFSVFIFFHLSTDAKADIRDQVVMSVKCIQDVFMEPVRKNGNASAKKAGVDCSVIKISTFAPITSRVITEEPAQTLVKDRTHASVLLAFSATIVKSK